MTSNNTESDTGMEQRRQRARAALKNLFVADSLAMPVHWFYSRADLFRQFPGGISRLQAAPEFHPSSIMSLHSTSSGGRGGQDSPDEIVGNLILKGKRRFWGQPGMHYHQGMQAGDNTLNAHCARALLRVLAENGGAYDRDRFLAAYIELLTADPPRHPDTYAESYHRAFFANFSRGLPPHRCAGHTHDTASIGGLVTLAPLALAERLRGTPLEQVQTLCREHLYLTHPDPALAQVCHDYVALIDRLLARADDVPANELFDRCGKASAGIKLPELCRKVSADEQVIGGLFSTACYISGSWPGVLYLAYRYGDRVKQALLANTNLGGDNVHRGAVLGCLLGLASGTSVDEFFSELTDTTAIAAEIEALIESTGA